MNQDGRERRVGQAPAGVRPWLALLGGPARGTLAGGGCAGLVAGTRWALGVRTHRLSSFAAGCTAAGAAGGLILAACLAFGSSPGRTSRRIPTGGHGRSTGPHRE